MKKRFKLWKVIIPLVLVLAIVGIVVMVQARQAAKNKPIIRTAVVKRGTVTASVSGNGVLKPWTTVEVKSNVGGQVTELAVDEGDRVTAGQLIARIDPADSLLSLGQSEADLASAHSQVSQAREGLVLQSEQTDAQLRSSSEAVTTAQLRLAQAQQQYAMQKEVTGAAVAQAEQGVETTRVRLAQARKQAELQGKLSTASVDQAEQGVESARARLAQAEESARVQPVLTQASIRQAQSALTAAQSTLEQTKGALTSQKITAAEAAFDQAQANYDYAKTQLARQKQLLEKGFVSRSQVDTAEQSFAVAKAGLDSARAKRDTVKREADEDVRSAEARVDQAEAQLRTAQANAAQDTLKQQDLAAAKAALKQAEAQLATAQANGDQDILREQDVQAARAALKQAEAQLATAKANRAQDTVKRQEVAAAAANLKQAIASLALAKTARRQEPIKEAAIVQANAGVKRAEASLTNAKTQLGYTTITAPRGGIVVAKYVEQGSIVTAGRASLSGSGAGVTIVDIADVSRMFVLVNVDETDIGQIRLGQTVEVNVDAFPDTPYPGKVTKIAPRAVLDANVTYVPVTVEVLHLDGKLKPEMNASCDFITQRKDDVVLVSNDAIDETADGAFVKVPVAGKPEPERRKVTLGLMGDDYTEVKGGLREGVKVITSEIEPTKLTGRTMGGGPGGPPPGGGMRRR